SGALLAAGDDRLLRSDDGGDLNRRAAGDVLKPAVFVDALAYDPAAPDRVYVGLNEYQVVVVPRGSLSSVELTRARSHVLAIAYKLLAAGAHGITVAKLSEAEVMAAAGITDILITGPVVGKRKATRLAMLAKSADPIAVVDCIDHVDMLDAAAREHGVRIRT